MEKMSKEKIEITVITRLELNISVSDLLEICVVKGLRRVTLENG